MENVFHYLRWRGDIPFATDPFNEVDALILAELVYTHFENVPCDGAAAVSIRDVRDAFFKAHTREEIKSSPSYTDKAALMLDEMADGARFQNTKLCRYVAETDHALDKQFAAVTFLLEDGTAYAAFRGTDNTVTGWKEDFNFSYLSETEGQRRAVDYLNAVTKAINRPFHVGGHSKGGNFSVYAASFASKEAQQTLTNVWNMDGPGFRKEITEKEGYLAILPKIVSIAPDSSVIGMLLERGFEHHFIKSAASGIVQHDGLTWLVERNRFVKSEPTESCLVTRSIIGGWLDKMDDQTRRSFTQSIFSVLEATGDDSFESMGEKKLESAEEILSSLTQLPKEKKQELISLVGSLIRSGGETAANRLSSLFNGKTNGEND